MRANNCLCVQFYYCLCAYLSVFGVDVHHGLPLKIFLVFFISSYTQNISEVNGHVYKPVENVVLHVHICLNNEKWKCGENKALGRMRLNFASMHLQSS
jgi:hypothetical protein